MLGGGAQFDAQGPAHALPRPGQGPLGLPGHPSNRMPTNLGGGTNESRVIVGDFREALILDRQGITVDESQPRLLHHQPDGVPR